MAIRQLCVTVVVASAIGAAPVRAQSSPNVRAAIQLAAEGRGDSARRLVSAELARSRAGDSLYVEALFWRARLAGYGDSAERDLRRVALEYSGSTWADDALLQLSQLALAAGNPASAFDLAGRVRSDYPDSELKPRAALWAARAAFEVGEPRTACTLLDSARVEGAADVEFVNQVLFYRGRCTAAVLAPPRPTRPVVDTASPASAAAVSSAPVAATGRDTAPPATAPAGGLEVQAAAANDDRAAQDVVRQLARAGLTAHVVNAPNGIRRVRLGPFATQQAADSAARAVKAAIGGTPFVVRP